LTRERRALRQGGIHPGESAKQNKGEKSNFDFHVPPSSFFRANRVDELKSPETPPPNLLHGPLN
jgi:hypothetical protein